MKKLSILSRLGAGASSCRPGAGSAPCSPCRASNQGDARQRRARLAAKRGQLVYDLWREVFEVAPHCRVRRPSTLAESYIRAQPARADRPAALVEFFTRVRKPFAPIEARIKAPLVALVAEGDLRACSSFARECADPKDATKKYSTTWFDIVPRSRTCKIAEHWDPAPKP